MEDIRTVLWDIDGTLLDFGKAETAAIHLCFSRFGLGTCTEAMLTRYKAINERYWQALERGEITRAETLTGRFAEFFSLYGLHTDISSFNRAYQDALAATASFNPYGLETVQALKGRVAQYGVTNGTVAAQRGKLKRSGLDHLLDGVFISEEIGCEKPAAAYFDAVFAAIGESRRPFSLIVGDSLTSDMQGGVNAGIRTCWYNPGGRQNTAGLRLDAEITDLRQIIAWLSAGEQDS